MAALALAALACGAAIIPGMCRPSGVCIAGLASIGHLLRPAVIVLAASVVIGATIVAARAARLLTAAGTGAARLERAAASGPLLAAMARTGVKDVETIRSPAARAFCSGAWTPQVYVTEGLVRMLADSELDAVLLHEAEHGRRRDPLRRALRRAGADLLFFLPLAEWWAARRATTEELIADRRAMARLGPRPVAAALLAVDAAGRPTAWAAFDGAAEARVAQLLGEPCSPTGAPGRVWLASAAGMATVFSILFCVATSLSGLH